MNYVIGEEIVLGAKPQRSTGPQPLNVPQVKRTVRNEYFEAGYKYSLYNIRPLPSGQFEYTFQRQDGEVTTYLFESISAAEQVIAHAKGDALPNHDDYYRSI